LTYIKHGQANLLVFLLRTLGNLGHLAEMPLGVRCSGQLLVAVGPAVEQAFSADDGGDQKSFQRKLRLFRRHKWPKYAESCNAPATSRLSSGG
jgi:hypothetical protein